MMLLTRAQALGQARADLGQYVSRILDAGLVPKEYAFGLARTWDRRLAELARLGPELPVAEEVARSLQVLSRELREPDIDPDAAVRWLDVFPDSVADLFPPSAVTFRLVDEEDADAAATATPTRSQIAAAA
jgi:hypothetical protein